MEDSCSRKGTDSYDELNDTGPAVYTELLPVTLAEKYKNLVENVLIIFYIIIILKVIGMNKYRWKM